MATDRLGDMRLFVEAADLGSLSAAGRKLGLSPAAASARLLKLERDLATRLFDRTTRQLRVTPEGLLYLEHCRIALQAIEDGEAALHARRQMVRGKVRLSATSDFGRNRLRKWLEEFCELYPEVTFSLYLTDAMSNLLQDEIDLAIRFSLPQDSALAARRLAPDSRMLCASPAYLKLHGVPRSPADLAQHRFALWATSAGTQNEFELTRGDERWLHVVPLDEAWDTNDGAMVREWALCGRCIAYKSLWDIADDVKAGRLQVLLSDWKSRPTSIHALFQRSRYMPPRVRVLLDFLAQRCEDALADLPPGFLP
jgi:DNA-binding transcriptional LysR family regulator